MLHKGTTDSFTLHAALLLARCVVVGVQHFALLAYAFLEHLAFGERDWTARLPKLVLLQAGLAMGTNSRVGFGFLGGAVVGGPITRMAGAGVFG